MSFAHTAARRPAALRWRSTLAALGAACWLSACGVSLVDKPERPQPYDLGSPLAQPAQPAQPMAQPLAVSRVQAPAALNGVGIVYRLDYSQQALQPRPYAHARWTMTAPQLLEQRLRQTLAASRPVVDVGRGLASVELHVELEEFSHIFSAPDASAGVVRLRATLIGVPAASGLTPPAAGVPMPAATGPMRVLGQRSFSASHMADRHDAAGGVQALRNASDDVLRQVADWANGLAQP